MHGEWITLAWAPSIWEMIIIGGVALIFFGKRLPDVGRNIGKGIVEFKKGLKGIEEEVEKSGEQSARKAGTNLTVAVSPAGSGTTTPVGATPVDVGVAQSIMATPNAGFVFVNWTAIPAGNAAFVDAGSTSTAVTLAGNCTVIANFKATAKA